MPQSTSIEVAQNIGSNAGSAIGLQIQSMTVMGSFIVRPPKEQTRPPTVEVVKAYLEYQQKPVIDTELADASAKLATLRDAFRGQARQDDAQGTQASEAGLATQPSRATGAAATEIPLSQQEIEIAELIKPLWNIPFRARISEDAMSEPLYGAMNRIFGEEQRHGANQRIVLLSEAGLGKTPALLEIKRQRAQESLSCMQDEKQSKPQGVIPFYIKLAHLRSGQPLPVLLAGAFESAFTGNGNASRTRRQPISADQMLGLLDQYTCLFLLDDLDELLASQQADKLQALDYFMSVYPEHQYVLACGVSAYRQQLGSLQRLYLDGLTEADLTQAKPPQAPIMDENEYKGLCQLSVQFVTNRSMIEAYLALDKASDLVRVKGRFLQSLMSYRLKHDEATYRAHEVDSFIAPLLEHLAINLRLEHTHDYGEQKLMQSVADYLERWREKSSWRQVLNALKETEVLARDDESRSWRFCDRADEAFFAASAVLHGQLTRQALLTHVSDYYWREVFEILVGLAPDAQNLIVDIMDQDVLTAASCAAFVGQAVSTAVEEPLIDSLQERMSQVSSSRRKFIVERIGQCAKPRAVVSLLQVLYRDWSSMVVMAAVKAVLGWSQRYSTDPEKQLDVIRDAEREVMHAFPAALDSVTALLRLYPAEGRPGQVDELCNKLKNQALSPRIRGLSALGLGFTDAEPAKNQAADALFEILEDAGVDDFLAWCVVEVLTRFSQGPRASSPGNPVDESQATTTDLAARIGQRARDLYDRKEPDDANYSRLRPRAVYLLGWITEGEKIDDLMRTALNDPNPFVRGYIVEAMARRDIQGARRTIEDHLSSETHPFVLRKTAEALGQIGTVESILVLEKYLRSQQASARWPAQAAIYEIKERYAL